MVPLAGDRQLAAHEQERHPRGRPLQPVEHPEVGELLPPVARLLAEERPLAVHHLVVGEREHEPLRVRVHRAERQIVVMPLPVDGFVGEVRKGVVHPPHVPLQVEPEAALRRRCRHPGPRRRLLGDRQDIGVLLVHRVVELPEEVHRLEVGASTLGVGDPLALVAGVVEVQHRRDGIDPQAVGVVALEPGDGTRHEEGPDFVAAVVEDRAPPVGMVALTRIGVLVEVSAVEVHERVVVGREVRRHPVEDHPHATLVQTVDHRLEVVGRAVPVGRAEVPRRLVPPRSVERVLHHREQFDMGEAVGDGVVGQRVGQLRVGREAARRRTDGPAPRPEVHLVHRDRHGAEPLTTSGQPLVVAPVVGGAVDHRVPARTQGRPGRDGVDPVGHRAVRADDAVAVPVARPDVGEGAVPDARATHGLQPEASLAGVATLVGTDHHVDLAGIGSPHGEADAGLPTVVVDERVSTEHMVQTAVGSFREQVEVELSELAVAGPYGCGFDHVVPQSFPELALLEFALPELASSEIARSRRRMPRNGIETQSGRWSSS